MIVFLIGCYSCEKDSKSDIKGLVQKGPYINGTSIQMYEMDPALNQTGKVYNTQINNNRGSFEINNINLASNFVEFIANGYYFNEITGKLSPSQLTLYALSDITDISTINVNILTHLEKERVEFLVRNGMSLSNAKKVAQSEILKVFGINTDVGGKSEMLDITINKEENAILLAISVILQGDRSVASLTELMADITSDIKGDGKIDDVSIIAELRRSALSLDSLPRITMFLTKRYTELGLHPTIPEFEKYVNGFIAFSDKK